MASSQNLSLANTAPHALRPHQQSATAQNKTLAQSNSAMHVKYSHGFGLGGNQVSPAQDARVALPAADGASLAARRGQGSSSGPGSALDFHPAEQSHTITNSPLKPHTTQTGSHSQLPQAMFSKAVQPSTRGPSGTSQGYQPSYLRETSSQKNNSYQSQSPTKQQTLMTSQNRFGASAASYSAKHSTASKYSQQQQQQTLSSTKRHGETSRQAKMMTRNDFGASGGAKNAKNRSGSQFNAGKKFAQYTYPASAAGRAANTQQRNRETDQEYSVLSSNQKRTHPGGPHLENSFTRLHKGNSSIVRSYERKLLQQSSSQVRKPSTTTIESSNSGSMRKQQTKYQFSNLHTASMNRLATQGSGSTANNAQLFNTRERPAQALAQHYQSNLSGGQQSSQLQYASTSLAANPLDSDRTAGGGSVHCDTGRNGANGNGNGNGNLNRSKGQKQPRQSKSSIVSGPLGATQPAPHGNTSSMSQQEPSQNHAVPAQPHTDEAGSIHVVAVSAVGSPTAAATPQPPAQLALSQSQSANQAPASVLLNLDAEPAQQQQLPVNYRNNLANLDEQSGTETSLSFTKRLIEETAERNQRFNKSEMKGATTASKTLIAKSRERDISQVAVYLPASQIGTASGSNNSSRLEIQTQGSASKPSLSLAQKFISPKIGGKPQVKPTLGGQGAPKTAMKQGVYTMTNSLISPMHARAPGVSNDKKQQPTAGHANSTSQPRGSSNTSNTVRGTMSATSGMKTSQHNFAKASAQVAQTLHSNLAFSPDKRPNISRSQQMQNNLYFKRGANKAHQNYRQQSKDQSVSRENKHQRMFAPWNSSTQTGPQPTPGASVSPSKGGANASGPGYLQSTFSHATKTAAKASAHSSYQLNRVRPNKNLNQQQLNQQASLGGTGLSAGASAPSQASQMSLSQVPSSVQIVTVPTGPQPVMQSAGSSKELLTGSAVKVLDQSSPRNASSLTQSHGPKTSSSNQTPSYFMGAQSRVGVASSSKKKPFGSLTQTAAQAMSTVSSTGNFGASHRGGATRGGIHAGKAVATREKRPQSKRGTTVDKTQQNEQATTSIRGYGKSRYIMPATKQSTSRDRNQTQPNLKSQAANSAAQPAPKMMPPHKPYEDSAVPENTLGAATFEKSRSEVPGASQVQVKQIELGASGVATGVARSVSNVAAEFAAAPKQTIEHNYKRKQDQIIEMIQSNMKRSEDIQQSLASGRLFSSVQKVASSRKSSCSNYSGRFEQPKPQQQQPQNEVRDYCTDRSHESFTASPSLTPEPGFASNQIDASRMVEPEAQVPLSTQKAPSPSKTHSNSISVLHASSTEKQSSSFASADRGIEIVAATVAPSSSSNTKNLFQKIRHENAGSLVSSQAAPDAAVEVEDVFDDHQLTAIKELTSSSEQQTPVPMQYVRDQMQPESVPSIKPIDRSSEGTPGAYDDAQICSPPASAPAQATKQSPRKQGNAEYEPIQLVASFTSPFEQAAPEDELAGDQTPMRCEDLEVVAEDLMEDRYSVLNSAASQSMQGPPVVSRELPLKRSDFVALYKDVLTQQEKNELADLELTNDTVYYAGDILQRKVAQSAYENKDDEDGYYVLQQGNQILYRFEVLKVLGKGSFAQVVSAIDHLHGVKVAVKINRNTEIDHKFAQQEGKLLRFLMAEDPRDEHNIVRLVEHVHFRQHQCFVFELLNTDLFEHLKENEFMGFEESQIRSYAAQLLKALVFLEERKVIHCDLKPENILCVDPARQQLKVVDFGSGCLTHEQVYTYVQSRYYRAPEVILRIPYSEKVDIWSLGCILAELFTGEPLFPGNNEQEQLEYIMELQGMFPENMIDKSRKKDHYFDTDYSPFLIEDPQYGILRIPESRRLEDAVPSGDALFLDFIASCLVLDPDVRPGAAEQMQHPWIRQHFGQAVEPQDHQGPLGYVPLRQSMERQQPKQTMADTVHEQLELQNNMLIGMGDADGEAGNGLPTQEYYEGRITQSDNVMISEQADFSFVPAKFDLAQTEDDDDADTIKFTHSQAAGQVAVSQSRQREEAGARASATEISPERPASSFLTHQQRMTSFVAAQQELESGAVSNAGRKTDAQPPSHAINLIATSEVIGSPNKQLSSASKILNKSPLKPSNETLLEHYKYEKQSKQGSNGPGSNIQQSQLRDLVGQGESFLSQHSSGKKQPQIQAASLGASGSGNQAAVVEEPKILSMTSSFQQQSRV